MSKPVIDPRLFIYSQNNQFSGPRYQDADVWGDSSVLAQGNTSPAYRQADDGGMPMQTTGFNAPNVGEQEALSDAFLQRGQQVGKKLFGRAGEVAQQAGMINQFNNQGVLNAQQLGFAEEKAEMQKKGIAAQTSANNAQAFMSLGSAALGAIGPLSSAFGNVGGNAVPGSNFGAQMSQNWTSPTYSNIWQNSGFTGW